MTIIDTAHANAAPTEPNALAWEWQAVTDPPMRLPSGRVIPSQTAQRAVLRDVAPDHIVEVWTRVRSSKAHRLTYMGLDDEYAGCTIILVDSIDAITPEQAAALARGDLAVIDADPDVWGRLTFPDGRSHIMRH